MKPSGARIDFRRGSGLAKHCARHRGRMRLYVRPTFDSTPLVKITKPKLIDLRSSLKADDEGLDVADKPLA